jgi:peptide-methionine (S)-S-oxide reductase
VKIPAPAVDERAGTSHTETAVFAGGCFWGVQGVFQHVRGVTRVTSGYSGGSASNAQYEMVGTGMTGHAESVEIRYDPTQISYGKLLQIFSVAQSHATELSGARPRHAVPLGDLPAHAGATLDCRGIYRPARHVKAYRAPIVTRRGDYKAFPAENYHQDLLVKNPSYPYIVINDLPKLGNLKTMFPDVVGMMRCWYRREVEAIGERWRQGQPSTLTAIVRTSRSQGRPPPIQNQWEICLASSSGPT